jgi:hypothetical protein
MEKDWLPLHRSSNPVEIEIIKNMLHEHSIGAIVINQQDSSYLAFGEATLYVQNTDYLRARDLIERQQHNNEDSAE